MGSYLSEPITEKASTDESNDRLNCGASSMQGWRIGQEDAHNCLLDFDTKTSFFAVYDGHGGAEVALYCAEKLPEFLKNLESYKTGDFEKALEEAFLGFDATIATPEVIAILKALAKTEPEAEESSDEDVNDLYEEAAMPIEQVMQKYASLKPDLKTVKDADKAPGSPYLKAKRELGDGDAGSASSSGDCEAVSSSCSAESDKSEVKVENGAKVPEIVVHSPDNSECPVSSNNGECTKKAEEKQQNGEVSSNDAKTDDVSSSSVPTENGEVTKKGKGGKALTKTKGVEASPTTKKVMPKRSTRPTVQQMYAKLLDYVNDESEDSEDEEDKTFEGPNEESSDDEEEGVNTAINEEASSEEDEEDEAEEEEDAELDDEDDEHLEFARNMSDEPGSNSGCTAVVALLKDDKLFVANAGDSRCIVCRNGQAVEMSFDHKPEDEPERERVVKAGGKVTSDGRVNGGLNLSRAIGDHAYKQNKELSDKEQMISAQPDVKVLTIDETQDEFMVLACDGIWNFMSSQEVVDFVRPAIKEGKKLSKICEEMFDHCLAPHTMGDGTGCDNMTAIIVKFRQSGNGQKRPASPEPEEDPNESKRAKTENAAAV